MPSKVPALKPLSKGGIESALERAERYRLLNEPSQAESICLDILEIDGENQKALVLMLLAITDAFAQQPGGAPRALALLPRPVGGMGRRWYQVIRALEHRQAQGRAFVALDLHLGEAGNNGQIHIVLFKITAGNGHGLDGLIDCAGADCLNLRISVLTHDACNGAGNGCRTGLGRNFDELGHDVCLLVSIHAYASLFARDSRIEVLPIWV